MMVTPTSVMVTLHANLYNSGHIFQSLIHFILLSTMCALNIIKLSLLFSSNGEAAMEFTQSRVLNTSNNSWQCFVSTIKYNPVNSITFGNLFMTLGETSYFQRTTTCYEKMKKKKEEEKRNTDCNSLSWPKSHKHFFQSTYRAMQLIPFHFELLQSFNLDTVMLYSNRVLTKI